MTNNAPASIQMRFWGDGGRCRNALSFFSSRRQLKAPATRNRSRDPTNVGISCHFPRGTHSSFTARCGAARKERSREPVAPAPPPEVRTKISSCKTPVHWAVNKKMLRLGGLCQTPFLILVSADSLSLWSLMLHERYRHRRLLMSDRTATKETIKLMILFRKSVLDCARMGFILVQYGQRLGRL